MNNRLTGVIPPVCTPLTDDGEVDVASFTQLLDHLIASGVHGLFILGSTSEVAYLTDEQRALVIRTAHDHVAGRVPVLTGVIDMTTPRVIDQAKRAAELGATALVATAPFYTIIGPVETERHFRKLHEAVDLPIFAYDIPACVHTKLPADLILRLAADGVLAGVKDSSGDDANLRGLIIARAARDDCDDFSLLTGSELMVDAALAMGADGVVPGLGNVDPAGYVRLYDLMMAGDRDAARVEQDRLHTLFGLVRSAPPSRMGSNSAAIGAFKAGVALQKVIATGRTADPQVPLNDEEIARVREHLVVAGLLN